MTSIQHLVPLFIIGTSYLSDFSIHNNTFNPSHNFLGHNFGNWSALTIIVYILLSTFFSIFAIVFPIALRGFFTNYLKWHLEFHPIAAIANILAAVYGLPHEDIITVLHASGEFTESQISLYAKFSVSKQFVEYKKNNTLFLRTNFFELFYVFTRYSIIIIGTWLTNWLLQIDTITWFQSTVINSILILYGLMLFIQNMLAQVFILLYNDYKVSDLVFIKNYDVSGCILEIGPLRTMIGTINLPLLKRLLEQHVLPKNKSTQVQHLINQKIGSNITVDHNSNDHTLLEIDHIKNDVNGTSKYFTPIILPPPMNENKDMNHFSSGRSTAVNNFNHVGAGNTQYSNFPFTHYQKSSQNENAYQSLLLQTMVPNMTFWQIPITKLVC